MNKVILVGRVGQDPQIKKLETGISVASFSLATSERFKDKKTGEKKETTEWHNIVGWNGIAEIIEKYVKKGTLLSLEGKNRTRSWDKDGQKHFITEVLLESLTILAGGKYSESEIISEEQQSTTNDENDIQM